MTSLFIGVVSHEGSRFSVSQGPGGLAQQLVAPLAQLGVEAHAQVNTADLHDSATLPVTDRMTQDSLTAQLHLEREWARFLQRSTGPRWWAGHSLRWLRRAEQALRSPGPRMTERLLNIELSHLDLLRAGLAVGSDWVLILEDDAAALDLPDCAAGLAGLMAAGPRQPQYVNVSQSFTNAELGIEHLLAPVRGVEWAGSIPRSVLAADRPVTNTVCAILYRGDFVSRLVSAMDALPMEPVVPIDWKLNLALMDLFTAGELQAGDCWVVEPAPIDQLSMRTLR
ncbi:MAG: hypothetical protein NTX29_05155 [Actinobacteria bacterium]|nr:hypothetical protein [Actinomycetota bacterium]